MSGLRTDKEVLDARDAVIAVLDALPPDIRQHAWYWIVLDVETQREAGLAYERLDDEIVKFLARSPARRRRLLAVKEKLLAALTERSSMVAADIERLKAADAPGSEE